MAKTSWSFKRCKTWCDVQQLEMENIILKDQLYEKAKIQIEKIKEIRKTVNGEDSFFENKKDIYNFQQIDITRSFFQSIFSGKSTWNTANPDQSNLVVQLIKFKKQAKSVLEQKKKKNTHTKNILLKFIFAFSG